MFISVPANAQISRVTQTLKLLRHVSVFLHPMFTPDQRTTHTHTHT